MHKKSTDTKLQLNKMEMQFNINNNPTADKCPQFVQNDW